MSSNYTSPSVTITGTISSGGSVLYKNHGNLSGRDLPDQHPIEAITGLSEILSQSANYNALLNKPITTLTNTNIDEITESGWYFLATGCISTYQGQTIRYLNGEFLNPMYVVKYISREYAESHPDEAYVTQAIWGVYAWKVREARVVNGALEWGMFESKPHFDANAMTAYITGAIANFVTSSDVSSAISAATANFATTSDVSLAISAATEDLITSDDVISAINTATANYVTSADVSTAISTATANFLASSDLTGAAATNNYGDLSNKPITVLPDNTNLNNVLTPGRYLYKINTSNFLGGSGDAGLAYQLAVALASVSDYFILNVYDTTNSSLVNIGTVQVLTSEFANVVDAPNFSIVRYTTNNGTSWSVRVKGCAISSGNGSIVSTYATTGYADEIYDMLDSRISAIEQRLGIS